MSAELRNRPRQLASLDSTTTLLLALARALRGQDFAALGHPPWLGALVRTTRLLPVGLRRRAYTVAGWLGGTPGRRMGEVRAQALAAWAAACYPSRRYPAVFIGSASGAAMHLCAALGAPWLPQTFLLPLRQCIRDPDDLAARLAHGRGPGQALLEANPQLALHHMADPVHDRPQQPGTGYFRVKLLDLPRAYREFLDAALPPGGLVVLVDCRLRWPVTRVAARHVFQVGGVGGATLEEYFHGGARVARFLAAQRARRTRWDPPAPGEEAPEAEWGFAPELAAAVRAHARERGLRVARLTLDTPRDLSPVVAALYREWLLGRGLPADTLLAEMFFLVEPYWMLRAGAVPYWVLFNTEPDLQRLVAWLAEAAPFRRIGMNLLSTAIDPIGMVPATRWRAEVLECAPEGRFLGTDPRRYPDDLGALARYHDAIERIARERSAPLERMPLPFAAAFVRAHGAAHGVGWAEEG